MWSRRAGASMDPGAGDSETRPGHEATAPCFSGPSLALTPVNMGMLCRRTNMPILAVRTDGKSNDDRLVSTCFLSPELGMSLLFEVRKDQQESSKDRHGHNARYGRRF